MEAMCMLVQYLCFLSLLEPVATVLHNVLAVQVDGVDACAGPR